MTRTTLVLDPTFAFATLEARLAALGFRRDPSVRPVTPDALPGETELAAWTGENGERLTYTFNPVVSLRVVAGTELATATAENLARRLPLLDTGALLELLGEGDPRRALLGILAVRALEASELAPAVAQLEAHPDATVRRAAKSAVEALPPGGEAAARRQALAMLDALCQLAVPVVAALVGPDGEAALESMRPRDDDYARVFVPQVADAVRVAYDELWSSPPEIDRLDSGEMELRVHASPAGMLRDDNELSRHFPGGYRALAPYLDPHRIWFVWRYLRPGEEAGTRYDGLVRLDDRWVWFPKPYRVVGEILQTA